MDLITQLDRAMEADRRPTRERQNHTAWDIGKCTRQLFYKWVDPGGAEWKPDAGFSWKLRLGEAVEAIVVKWLSQADVYHINSRWADFKHPDLQYIVRYQLDLEVLDDDSQIAVVDVKSGYGGEISEMKRTGRPKHEYEEQVAFYTVARRRKRGYLLFIGRDSAYRTSRLYEWRREWTHDGVTDKWIVPHFLEISVHDGHVLRDTGITWEAQLSKLKTLETALADHNSGKWVDEEPRDCAPPREYVMGIKDGELRDDFQADSVKWTSHAQCRYCSYQKRCWTPELAKYPKGTNNVEALKAAGIEGRPVKKAKKSEDAVSISESEHSQLELVGGTDGSEAARQALPGPKAGAVPVDSGAT